MRFFPPYFGIRKNGGVAMNYMDFRRKIVNDQKFSSKFANCKTAEELVKAAAEEGYQFTVDDIRNNTEILPEELAAAAGGINSTAVFAVTHIVKK